MENVVSACNSAIEASKIEGAIIVARHTSGKRYSKALGKRTLPDGSTKDLQSSDLCFLASCTKLLTSIAALQCCEKGLLGLDEDLSKKYPQWFNKKVLTKFDEGDSEPTYEGLKNPLTLRHLLTHSSGSVYQFLSPKLQRWVAANPSPPGGPGGNVTTKFPEPLVFQPGEGWLYGAGLDWAGLLIEHVTGTQLDEYFRKNILKPLGIAETEVSFFPVKEGLGERMPDLNPKDPKGMGLSVSMGNSFLDEGDPTCYGGGGAYASPEAYADIMLSILSNDGKLLKPESVKMMNTPQLESKAKTGLQSTLTGDMGFIFRMGTSGTNSDAGFSGLLVTEDGDESGLGKGALLWGGGINSAWVIDPASETCGIIVPQLGLPADMQTALELKAVFRKDLITAFK
jgi:CubicO group peptidase (beta-lactamase class C family)